MADEIKIKKTTTKKNPTVKAEMDVTAVVKTTTTVKKTGSTNLTVNVMGLNGEKQGTVTLPKEVFDAKVNPTLMAQAVRVYLANQRIGTASTKTRGEVTGSTRKIYRQKGTGRARHGSIKAPVFVGGGIVFGPQPRDYRLSLPQKMRKAALFSSLTVQFKDNKVQVVDNFDGVSGKTKEMVALFKTMDLLNKQKKAHKVLFVTADNNGKQAVRNIEGVTLCHVKDLNTYEVLNSQHIVFVKNSLESFSGKEKEGK